MKKNNCNKKRDQKLGLNQKIDRRDFLNSTLLGAGSALYSMSSPSSIFANENNELNLPNQVAGNWYGYGGVGDSRYSHGNTPDILKSAHALRDGLLSKNSIDNIDASEKYDLVIVGGGIAGLGAAQRLMELDSNKKCLILENHPIFGGEAKRNEFNVNGHIVTAPQGSNSFYYKTKNYDIKEDLKYIDILNIPEKFSYATMKDNDQDLVFAQENYDVQMWGEELISKGHFVDKKSHNVEPQWVKDIWKDKLKRYPLSEKFRKYLLTWKYTKDMPNDDKKTNAWLDNMTYKDYIEKVMGLDEEVTKFADPVLASSGGMGCDVMSAYIAMLLGMYGLSPDAPVNPLNRHSFPGGNDGFARHFIKWLIPDAITGGNKFEDIMNNPINFENLDHEGNSVRIRLNSNVVNVAHTKVSGNSDDVNITYYRDNKLHKVNAKAVVMASGGWINKHIISDLPESHLNAYNKFNHAPMLVANVALTNWRFLQRLGITACQWTGGFGFHTNIRKPMHIGEYKPDLDPNKPITLTFYVSFEKANQGFNAQQQSRLGQYEMLGKSYIQYEREIREQMVRMFSSGGFDPITDIAGIILNRWGHAYVTPTPGFFYSKDGGSGYADIIKSTPFGKISFGHSELRGYQHWGPAAAEGSRAVDQIFNYL
ncbi:MAG: NAD(P)-binding protein [Pseudomonadota bacterium]|nr:NAD(P)-binding protein [Pseudomonadota bacterium]